MTDAHPNVELFRQSFRALQDADPNALRSTLADDVVWHMVGSEEPIRGADDVIATLTADMDGVEIDGDLHDVLANDDHVVALVSVRLRRGQDSTSYRAVEIGHVRDGKLTERWAMVDDFEAMASFWG